MSALAALEAIAPAFNRRVLVVAHHDVVVVWSKAAEELTGLVRHLAIGQLLQAVLPFIERGVDVDGELFDVPLATGETTSVRRFARASLGAGELAHLHVEVWDPIVDAARGDVDVEQLLAYAKDLAIARAAERERSRELQEALARLEATVRELHAANAQLEEQKHSLQDEVRGRTEELKAARRRLDARSATEESTSFHGIVSAHPKMHRLFDLVRQIGPSDVSVLIHGESGTGKELLARAVHAESRRARGAFVAVNCATLTTSLAESLLFGHKKGAFTSASADYEGVFAQAEGGTLFLDEVAEIPLDVQSKLLRALQEREFTPLGGSSARRADVRIVAATHRDLRGEVDAGRFREDLMYRLRVAVLEIPSLAERRTDLLELFRAFLARHNAEAPRRIESFSPAAVRALLDYPWPGNVRELENALDYAFAVARGRRVELDDLPRDVVRPFDASAPIVRAPRETIKVGSVDDGDPAVRIEDALRRAGGKIGEAARLLGVSRATFHRMRVRHAGKGESV